MCVRIRTRRFFANRLFIVASCAPCDTYTTQSYLSLSLCLCVCLFAFYISFSNRDDACQFWCSIKRFDYSKFLIITISTPLFCFRCFFCDKSLNIHMHSTSQNSSSQHTAKEFNSNLPLIYFSFKKY